MPYFKMGDEVRVTARSRIPELQGVIGEVQDLGFGDTVDGGSVVVTFREPQTISGTILTYLNDSAYAFELVSPPSTTFAKLLRDLAEHRDEMRDMMDVLEEHDNDDEFREKVMQRTGNTPLWLGQCDGFCAPTTSPERRCRCPECMRRHGETMCPEVAALQAENVALRRELQDRENFIVAMRSAVENRKATAN